MPRTQTLNLMPRPATGLMGRVAGAVRSYWTGPYSLKDPELNRIFGRGSRSSAGEIVNEFTMFTCAAVYDAINQISSDVAKLPLNLKKRRKDGGSDDYLESKTYRLLKHSPNPETRTMVLRQTITKDALVGKGGFAEIERDTLGRPSALWYIESHRVQPFHDMGAIGPDGRRDPLRYRVDGQQVFEAKDILHVHGLGPDTVVGFEMVQIAREAIGLALASQQFASAFFGNGTRFGGVLSSDNDLDDDQKEEIRKNIEALHARADKAFRLLVLGAGFKFAEAGVKPNDAQMKEIRDQQVMEIARFFNMPLHKLKLAIPGAVSYASVEMADLDYYKGCLLNWITLWEQELEAKLISPLELGSQYIRHNAKAFLRGDTAARTAFYAALLDRGVYNADTVLELEDENPQPDGLGKMYLVQGAQVPKDQISDMVAAKIKKDETPPPAPVAPPPTQGTPDDEPTRAAIEALAALVAEARSAYETAKAEFESASASSAEERLRLRGEVESAAAALRSVEAALVERTAELTQTRERERILGRANTDLSERLTAAGATVAEWTERANVAESALARTAADLAAVESARAGLEADLRAAEELVREAEVRDTEDERRIRDLEARVQTADGDTAAVQAELSRAIAERESARADLEAMGAERVRLDAALADATAAVLAMGDAKAVLERERDAATGARDAAIVEAETAATEKASEHGHRRAVEAERDAIAANADIVRQQLEAERRRSTAVIAAHRGLLLDAVARMARREVQHARSKQQTPEKFRRWLSGFQALHEAVCAEALLPAIRAHLAWQQSDLDPVEVTATFVREHIDTFTRQALKALDADPNDFHALIDLMLTRWETERPVAVADAFLTQLLTSRQP